MRKMACPIYHAEYGMYMYVLAPGAPRPPPHHRVGSPPLGAQMALGLQWECIPRFGGL